MAEWAVRRLLALSMLAAMVATSASCGVDVGPERETRSDSPQWIIDPEKPGDSLPPVGRSLFDFLMTQSAGEKKIYRVPFPFPVLLSKIARQVQVPDPEYAALKQVLIPLGRSLQRNAAGTEFFKYPRVVVAVDAAPRARAGHAGMLLKDRLYLGYHEKAGLIEVISYNEAAGRFEFQVVKDYRRNADPKVFYANRAICTACHQNQAPIFSRPLWEETNANPAVAEQLAHVRSVFYGTPARSGVDIPNAIDDATDRANLIGAAQWLWQHGCGEDANDLVAVECRAGLFTLTLQHRLSGERGFDTNSSHYRQAVLSRLVKRWRRRWPAGLYLPNPDIPNRNPLQTADFLLTGHGPERIHRARLRDLRHVPAALEPLNRREPLAHWPLPRPNTIDGMILGLAEFLAGTDVERLDEHLFGLPARGDIQRTTFQSRCGLRHEAQAGREIRLSFHCRPQRRAGARVLRMRGRLYLVGERVARGSIDWLSLSDGYELTNLTVTDGILRSTAKQTTVRLRVEYQGLNARRVDGQAIESAKLRWRNHSRTRGVKPSHGAASAVVKDDFSPIETAIDEWVRQTRSGKGDSFASEPFRRASLMPALFTALGMKPVQWCCIDDSGMPAAAMDTDPKISADVPGFAEEREAIGDFYHYCARCHRTRERFPPNFLHGNRHRVSENLAHCAQRLYYRLQMWRLPDTARPKTPMPPVTALLALQENPARWANSESLARLQHHVGDLLEAQTGRQPDLQALATRGYEDLRSCLPDVAN